MDRKTRTGRRALQQPRRPAAWGVTSGAIAVLLLCGSLVLWLLAPAGHNIARTAQIGGPFHLVDDRGQAVTDRSFPGKYLIVYFGYTMCRDVCPATLSTLAAALDRLGQKSSRVQPLFITIDPLRDTAPVLHRYVAEFTPRLVGLRGTAAELSRVEDEYRVIRLQNDSSGPAGYSIDHSSVLYLMAPDGSFLAPIPADAQEMVIAHAISRYLS